MTRNEIIVANPIGAWLEGRGVRLTHDRKRAERCPLKEHTRKDNVAIDHDKNLWHCHACSRGGTVIDWLAFERGISVSDAMRELAGTNGGKLANSAKPKIVKTYDYTDEDGTVLFQCVRFEPKNFKQRRPDGKGDWIWNLQGVRLVSYRLPEILKAEEVWIVEGEKDADNLSELGFTATCNPMGAGKWRPEYNECLRGKRVVIVPDNDAPGLKHADSVASSLQGIAAWVKIVKLLDTVKDVTDFIATFTDKADASERLSLMAESGTEWAATIQTDGNAVQLRDEPQDDQPLPPFPVECLPGVAGDMARAIAECERVQLSLSGSCVLGIISASIGAGLSVKSGPQRTTPGNLFILVSAQSGTGKSESFRHAARPFHEYEQAIIEEWSSTSLPRLHAEKDTLESEYKRAQKEICSEKDHDLREEIRHRMVQNRARLLELEREMQSPVLSCEDITTERLASLLSKRGEVLASLSPDAGNVVNNLLGRYNKLDRTDESVYLKAYSGDYCRVDRIGREPVVLQHPCLTVLWLTQPDKLDSLLRERSLTEGGLIPRLLMCHTNCQPEPIPDPSPVIPQNILEGYNNLVRALLTAFRLSEQRHILQVDAQAAELLRKHYNSIVDRRKGDLKDVTSFAARWTEQAWRIAVVLHAMLHGEDAHRHCLSVETACIAIRIADWFATQQLAILSGGRWKANRDKRSGVLLLLAELPEGISSRQVQRARIVSSADDAHELLEAMERDGVLYHMDNHQERGGHPVRLYKKKVAQ